MVWVVDDKSLTMPLDVLQLLLMLIWLSLSQLFNRRNVVLVTSMGIVHDGDAADDDDDEEDDDDDDELLDDDVSDDDVANGCDWNFFSLLKLSNLSRSMLTVRLGSVISSWLPYKHFNSSFLSSLGKVHTPTLLRPFLIVVSCCMRCSVLLAVACGC